MSGINPEKGVNMKKLLVGGVALLLAASIASADVTLSSTFGGDEDNIWGDDFMSWSRKKDDPDTTDKDESDDFESSTANASERLQLDYSSEKIDGRIRLEFNANQISGKNAPVRLRGFARFTPVEQIQFAAGNDFFTKYGVSAAYLAAADDTYSSGKMAESGLTFNTKFSGLKFVANWAGDSEVDNIDKLGLNFGADWVIPDAVKLGATFKNVTSDDRTIGVFAGLGSVENLVLNAGYIYNDKDKFYDKNKSEYGIKHALQASAGYTFKDAGIKVSADVISALTNEYIKDGETEEYKNSDGDKIYPFYTRAAASFAVTENVSVKGDVQLSTIFGQDNSTKTVVYPSVSYKLPKKMGSVSAGVRFTFEDKKDNGGLQKFSIPLCWKWTPVSVKSE